MVKQKLRCNIQIVGFLRDCCKRNRPRTTSITYVIIILWKTGALLVFMHSWGSLSHIKHIEKTAKIFNAISPGNVYIEIHLCQQHVSGKVFK